MGTFDLSRILNYSLLVILVLVVICVLAILLSIYWRQQTHRDLKLLRSELRRQIGEYKVISSEIQAYSVDDPEPYGKQTASLHAELGETGQGIKESESGYVALREREQKLESGGWRGLFTSPHKWLQLSRDAVAAKEDLTITRASLVMLRDFEHKFGSLSLDVAAKAREVSQLQKTVDETIESLQGNNIHGAAFQNAIQTAEDCRDAIAQIPDYFYDADEKTVLEQSNKSAVAQAHQILREVQPQLESLLVETQDWLEQFYNLVDQIENMQAAVIAAESAVAVMPAGLDLANQIAQVEHLKAISQNLRVVSTKMAIENLQETAKETVRITSSAEEMDRMLRNARHQHISLVHMISELNEDLKNETAKFAALGTSPVYPIAWGPSTETLTRISEGVRRIGAEDKVRTAQRVEQDLQRSVKLKDELKALSLHREEVAEQHAEILSILTKSEFQRADDWMERTRALADKAQAYAPENWAKKDDLTNLEADLIVLEKDFLRLLPDSLPEPIQESNISVLLEDIRHLQDFYSSMRVRAAGIQSRFEEMQARENESRVIMENARAALNQIQYLVRSNEFLATIASRDIERLSREVSEMLEELANRERGSVDKKAKRTAELQPKIKRATNLWLDKITADIWDKMTRLTSSLESLDDTVPLNENAVESARQLLSSKARLLSPQVKEKNEYLLDEIPDKLKQRCDTWQTCYAAILSLQEIEAPVLDAMKELNRHRALVRDHFQDLSRLSNSKANWPPTTVSGEAYQGEFRSIEDQFQALREEPVRAIRAVAQLGDLSARSQILESKLRAEIERGNREQAGFERLQIELDDLVSTWGNLRKMYRDRKLAREGIKELLDEINRERDRIRRAYQGGEVDYSGVYQVYQSLVNHLRSARVLLDEETLVDIDGHLTIYRP